MQCHAPAPPIGTWDLDPVAERVRYAAEFKQRLGIGSAGEYDPTALWRERVHPDDLVPMRDALFAHIAGRSSHYQMQFRLRAGHGGYRWVLSCGQAVERDRDGRARRVVGTLADLGELHEAALRRVRSEMQSRLGQELRTPLNAVLGFAQLLQAQLGTAGPDVQRRQLAHIEQGGWQLLGCIERLVDKPPAQGGQAGGGSRASS